MKKCVHRKHLLTSALHFSSTNRKP